MNRRILHVDSRQKLYHKEFAGIAADVPPERIFPYQHIVESLTGINCTAISTVKAASSQTGQSYDVDDLFNNTPHNNSGAYPPDTFATMIKRGLLRFGTAVRDVLWKSYWRVDTQGSGDKLDNTISAMNHANSGTTAWSNFYPNWMHLVEGEVVPQGEGKPSDHDWYIAGWKQVNGVLMAVVDFHLGTTARMPREVFNVELSKWGCGTGIPATQAIEDIKRRDFFTWISDQLQNLWHQIFSLQQTLQTVPPDSIVKPLSTNPIVNQTPQSVDITQPNVNKPMTHPTIADWANAVKQVEGWTPGSPSMTHNNPGNLGYTSLTASWGGIKGSPKADGGYFCRFADYDTGFKALCNFLTLGAENHLLQFHQARTLGQFSSVYGNTGLGYGMQIAKILNVPVSMNIADFLT